MFSTCMNTLLKYLNPLGCNKLHIHVRTVHIVVFLKRHTFMGHLIGNSIDQLLCIV